SSSQPVPLIWGWSKNSSINSRNDVICPNETVYRRESTVSVWVLITIFHHQPTVVLVVCFIVLCLAMSVCVCVSFFAPVRPPVQCRFRWLHTCFEINNLSWVWVASV